MAIYKLGDIFSKKPEYGLGLPSLAKGQVKYLTQSDLKTNVKDINKFVNSKSSLLQIDDFLISRAGTIDSYYFDSDEKVAFAGYLVRYSFNKDILKNKYMYYWTKTKYFKDIVSQVSKSGTTMPKLNPPEVSSIYIDLPSIEIQKQIIDIIEPIENIL